MRFMVQRRLQRAAQVHSIGCMQDVFCWRWSYSLGWLDRTIAAQESHRGQSAHLQWMQARKAYHQVTTPTPFLWQGTAQIGRTLIDFIETVTYRQGRFYQRGQVITGPP